MLKFSYSLPRHSPSPLSPPSLIQITHHKIWHHLSLSSVYVSLDYLCLSVCLSVSLLSPFTPHLRKRRRWEWAPHCRWCSRWWGCWVWPPSRHRPQDAEPQTCAPQRRQPAAFHTPCKTGHQTRFRLSSTQAATATGCWMSLRPWWSSVVAGVAAVGARFADLLAAAGGVCRWASLRLCQLMSAAQWKAPGDTANSRGFTTELDGFHLVEFTWPCKGKKLCAVRLLFIG